MRFRHDILPDRNEYWSMGCIVRAGSTWDIDMTSSPTGMNTDALYFKGQPQYDSLHARYDSFHTGIYTDALYVKGQSQHDSLHVRYDSLHTGIHTDALYFKGQLNIRHDSIPVRYDSLQMGMSIFMRCVCQLDMTHDSLPVRHDSLHVGISMHALYLPAQHETWLPPCQTWLSPCGNKYACAVFASSTWDMTPSLQDMILAMWESRIESSKFLLLCSIQKDVTLSMWQSHEPVSVWRSRKE